MCAHHFRHPYILCVKINNISMSEDNALIWFPLAFHVYYCGFLHLFYAFSCGLQGVPIYIQSVPNIIRFNGKWFIVTFIKSTTHIHAYFYIFLLVLWHVTSTSEMALIDSDNHGYGTHVYFHYTLNDIMLQMTQVFIFTFVVQWRLVLLWKCWAFVNSDEFLWYLLNLWYMWLSHEWQLKWNDKLYKMGNKLSVNGFWAIISWSKKFPGKHMNTLWHWLCGL